MSKFFEVWSSEYPEEGSSIIEAESREGAIEEWLGGDKDTDPASIEVKELTKARADEMNALSDIAEELGRPYSVGLKFIRDVIREYVDAHGKYPVSLSVSQEVETWLMFCTAHEIGSGLVERLVTGGTRYAFESIYGLSVTWDAPETQCNG